MSRNVQKVIRWFDGHFFVVLSSPQQSKRWNKRKKSAWRNNSEFNTKFQPTQDNCGNFAGNLSMFLPWVLRCDIVMWYPYQQSLGVLSVQGLLKYESDTWHPNVHQTMGLLNCWGISEEACLSSRVVVSQLLMEGVTTEKATPHRTQVPLRQMFLKPEATQRCGCPVGCCGIVQAGFVWNVILFFFLENFLHQRVRNYPTTNQHQMQSNNNNLWKKSGKYPTTKETLQDSANSQL